MVDDNTWTARSQTASTSTDSYSVVMTAQGCSVASCSLKCTGAQCNRVCRHMYTCECYDYSNGHLCKHIHAVAMQTGMESDPPQTESMSTTEPCELTTPALIQKENEAPGTMYAIQCCVHAILYLLFAPCRPSVSAKTGSSIPQ